MSAEDNSYKLINLNNNNKINAGDKSFEEKLKVITLAYTQLKNTYRQKIGK